MIPDMLHIHRTSHHTRAAAIAAVRIHLHAREGKPVEQAVDCTQRADEAAEGPVAENADQADYDHDYPFAGEEHTELIK